jgi:Heparinase II/III-like protein/Heparinase II/III N-terminus
VSELLARARRASRHPPRYLFKRVREIVARRLHRPWSNVYPHLVAGRTVARAAGARSVDELWERLQRAPFFLGPPKRAEWARTFREHYPEGMRAIVAAADRARRHEFDLLGSGAVKLGPSLPWHTDFKTGREWPIEYSPGIHYSELDRPTDIKLPWELSRCQHFTALGQAYWLTGDERYPQEFVAEVNDWIAHNPWSYGVNWACAMDVALRAVSWIWGFYYMSASAVCTASQFRGAFLRALYLHGEYVATHIERSDVNGNHYLCDAVGLVFLGSFFRTTRKGAQWLATGRQMLVEEIFNQTSEDGVDFEKATAYHRLVLEAFLTSFLLLELHSEPVSAECRARLERMIEFVEAYVRPDGTIPLIGDGDDGRIQKLGTQALNDHRYLLSAGAALFGRADFKRAAGRFWEESFWMFGPGGRATFEKLPPPDESPASKAFPDGGFFVLRSQNAHVTVDCGEVGMHGRGGHGHNDILGVTIWLNGHDVVTDCGSYLYTASREWRNRFRSTAFHNVVQVNNEELNRFISPDHLWTLHDDARPRDVVWKFGPRVDYFRGGHTGYQRLDPPIAVAREVALLKGGPDVIVRDSIDGAGQHELTWRFHLGPAVTANVEGNDVHLSIRGSDMWLQVDDDLSRLTPTIEGGWVSPSYGVRIEIQVVVWRGQVKLPIVATTRFGPARMTAGQIRMLISSLPNEREASVAR